MPERILALGKFIPVMLILVLVLLWFWKKGQNKPVVLFLLLTWYLILEELTGWVGLIILLVLSVYCLVRRMKSRPQDDSLALYPPLLTRAVIWGVSGLAVVSLWLNHIEVFKSLAVLVLVYFIAAEFLSKKAQLSRTIRGTVCFLSCAVVICGSVNVWAALHGNAVWVKGWTSYQGKASSLYSDLQRTKYHLSRIREKVLLKNLDRLRPALAYTLTDIKWWGPAEKEWKNLVSVNPYQAEAHYNIGLASERQNKLLQAEEEYLKALEIVPAHQASLQRLKDVLIRQGKKTEALELEKRLKEWTPSNDVRFTFGRKVRLLGYDLKEERVSPDNLNIKIKLYFLLERPIGDTLDLYVHFYSGDEIFLNQDLSFAEGRPCLWKVGQVVLWQDDFTIPAALLSSATFEIGMWDRKYNYGNFYIPLIKE